MPEFLLQLDTDKVEFISDEEACTSVVKIKNTQKDKYLYKIKCTSNELFRVRRPLGYIKPGEAEEVKLMFAAGKQVPESGKHYFVICYRKADGSDAAPRSAWQGKDPEAMKRLYVNFSKKKEEEKDSDKKQMEWKEEEAGTCSMKEYAARPVTDKWLL